MFPWGLFFVTSLPAVYVFFKQAWWFEKRVVDWIICFGFIFLNSFVGMIFEIIIVLYFSDKALKNDLITGLKNVILFLTLGVSGVLQYVVMLIRYQRWLKQQEDSWIG